MARASSEGCGEASTWLGGLRTDGDRDGPPASLPPDFSTRWCGSSSPRGGAPCTRQSLGNPLQLSPQTLHATLTAQPGHPGLERTQHG